MRHICNDSHSHIFKRKYQSDPVVLKFLSESAVENHVVRYEFAREISVLLMLHHLNILQLYGSSVVKNASTEHQRPLFVLVALNGDILAYHLSLNKFLVAGPSAAIFMRGPASFWQLCESCTETLHPHC